VAVEYQGELERRKAVLRRFRELLVQQREKFDHYLIVLDHEKTDIETGDIDKLVSHVELEEQIVSEIYTFQKVIDPLEDLYRASYSAGEASAEAGEVPELKNTLVELRDEVLARNAENRVLLKRRMETLRTEIAEIHRPMAGRRSVYAGTDSGSIVDIKG
jgi:hypothetical protein